MTPNQNQSNILLLYLQNVSRILNLAESQPTRIQTSRTPFLASGIIFTQEPNYDEMSFTMPLPSGADPASSIPSIFSSILQSTLGGQQQQSRHMTQAQIQAATRTFVYNPETPLNDAICPITHQEYRQGDILCEINSCKHVFKQSELFRWLDINSTCPVCRISLTSPAQAQAPAHPPQRPPASTSPQRPTLATSLLGTLDEEALNNIINQAFDETIQGITRNSRT